MSKKTSQKKTVSKNTQMPNQLIVAHVFLLLYMISCFVPLFNAMDYDAPQWLYVSILNIASLIFILKNNAFFQAFQLEKKSRLYFALLIGFFTVGCLSMITAINVSESLVHLSRLVNIVVAFFCVFTFVRKDPKAFFEFAGKVSIFLVAFYSWRAINYFLENSNQIRSLEFVNGFRSGFSSINIYTAFIVVQMPLLIYGFLYASKFWKYASGVSFFMGIMALLFVGSRTALLSFSFIFIATVGFLVFGIVKKKSSNNLKKETIILGIVPLLAVFLVLNINRVEKGAMNSISDILNPKNLDFYKGRSAVQSNISDAKEIMPTNIDLKLRSRISSGRFSLWELAFRNFKANPVLGVGYGNYKAVGKREHYQNFSNNKGMFANPRRAHNDFLEKLAETGIVGFLVYVSLFLLPLLWFLGLIRRTKDYHLQWMYFAIFLIAAAYTFDALLNFPLERPPIQFYFILAR